MGKAWHPELELLSALADGELGPAEGKYARLHVAGCAECTAQVASFSGLDQALAAPMREELAWEALKRDLAALPSGVPSYRTDAAIAALTQQPPRARPRTWLPSPAPVALRLAAAAVVVFAIIVGLIPTGTPPEQAEAPAQAEAYVAGVQQAVLHSKSNTLYVLRTEQGAVAAVNATTYEPRALIAVGGRPSALALNLARDTVLVLDSTAKTLTEIDTNANRVIGSTTVDVAGTLTTLAVNETSGQIVVTSIPLPPRGPRPAPTPDSPTPGAQVAVLDTVTKKLEQITSVVVAPSLVVPDPAGRQTLLVSPEATTVVDASYRPLMTVQGGVAAAFDLRGKWFGVLSNDGAGSKLTFVGEGAPDALQLDGAPASITPMPSGGFAVLVAKGQGGRIFVVDGAGRASSFTDVERVGDLDYDARGERFTVTRGGTVASVALPLVPVAASPSAPATAPASPSADASPAVSPSPLTSADPTATDVPDASASPGASAAPSASPSVAPSPSAAPARVVAVPSDAKQIGDGLYRLELAARYAPIVTANGGGRVWFVDQRNSLDALDIESGTVLQIAQLPADATIKALGVGPDYVYAADVAKGRLFLLDLDSERLTHHPLPAFDVSAMTVSPGGVVWIAVPGSSQLISFTPLSKQMQAVDVRTSGIVALEADGAGRVWFSTGLGLGYYLPGERRVTSLSWTGGLVTQLLAGRRDTLWVANATGQVISVKDGATITLAASVGRPVTALTLDARGKPWYLAPAPGGSAYRAVSGGEERTVPGPAVGLALNSQGRSWLFDPRGGFLLGLEATQ